MPYQKVLFKPGINREQTPLMNESMWSFSNLIRFFQGMLQKLGGWTRVLSTALVGTCRGILTWADLNSNVYIACGTEQRLMVINGGVLYDITPIRRTVNLTNPFTTFSSQTTVDVADTANSAAAGDWIYILNPASIGGIVLQGFYQIASLIDANDYAFAAQASATGSVAGGGTAANFATQIGQSTVTVTLNNHGYSMNQVYTIYISTVVGGLTLFGQYIVQSVINANQFTITATSGASGTTNGYENGGNIQVQYLIASGLKFPATAAGYGEGGYGFGGYGIGGVSPTPTPLRQWSLGAWGQQLLAAPTQGSIYAWNPSAGFSQNPAVILAGAPVVVQGFFIAMPEQQVVAFGATDPSTGNPDPMLIRFCDVANYNSWTASAANQAGSFRLPRGSKIVGALQGPQYGLLWTDLALWAMQYVQPPLVYGFNEIASGCGLFSMRAMCVLGTDVFWMSLNGFFVYSGGTVEPLPCTVWDILFGSTEGNSQGINLQYADCVTMGGNSHFNEFFLFYPSLAGGGDNDSYVKYNKAENVWDYGSLIRTAWTDQAVGALGYGGGNPVAVDGSGLVQQHEQGNDADNVPMISSAKSGWFKITDGTLYIFVERMIPDFTLEPNSTVQITVEFADYPNDTPLVKGPFIVTNSTEYFIIRGRGRFARVGIQSTGDYGSFFRLGELLYLATPSGRR